MSRLIFRNVSLLTSCTPSSKGLTAVSSKLINESLFSLHCPVHRCSNLQRLLSSALKVFRTHISHATPIPFAYRVFNGRGVDWLQYLLERYGKVVRVRPNELSYADPAAWHDIFLNCPLLPKPSFRVFDTPGLIPNMNEVVSHTEHNLMRRILAPGFSDRALREQEYIVQKYTTLLVKRFQEAVMDSSNGSADIELYQWCRFTAFDIIGDLFFGESFHSLRIPSIIRR